MAKLLEKTGAELIASLVNIATPIGNLAHDEKLFEKFVDGMNNFKKNKKEVRNNNLAFIMSMYADVVPLLFSKEHTNDILAILAEIEGKSVQEMLSMKGSDLTKDFIAAWREQIAPFVDAVGLTV